MPLTSLLISSCLSGADRAVAFDHGGGLIICQFLDAPLPCYNIAHLREQQQVN